MYERAWLTDVSITLHRWKCCYYPSLTTCATSRRLYLIRIEMHYVNAIYGTPCTLSRQLFGTDVPHIHGLRLCLCCVCLRMRHVVRLCVSDAVMRLLKH